MKEINSLIHELKRFDNKEGYRLKYQTIKTNLEPTIKKLIQIGEPTLDSLHTLIKHEEAWSCLFALNALKEIRSEKSIPFLIEFIVLNEDGAYWESCEEAMYALNNIGKPAIEPLIEELEKQFGQKIYLSYLVASLTGIIDNAVYNFMLNYTKRYLDKNSQYRDWFWIHHFIYDFTKQGKDDVLPILKEIQENDYLSEFARIELRDTIHQLEDPKGFKEETDREFEKIERRYDSKRKLGKNEQCWCGSGKKYKKCCLEKDVRELGKPRKIYIINGEEYIGNLDEFD